MEFYPRRGPPPVKTWKIPCFLFFFFLTPSLTVISLTDDQKIHLLYSEALMERLSLYRLHGNDLHDVNGSSFLHEILLNLENNIKRC